MIPAIEGAVHRATASEILIVIAPDRACVNEAIDGSAINRAIMIPSLVQLSQHVGFGGVVTDLTHKAALRFSVHVKVPRHTGVSRYFISRHSAKAGATAAAKNMNAKVILGASLTNTSVPKEGPQSIIPQLSH